jgi:hypothetical protein
MSEDGPKVEAIEEPEPWKKKKSPIEKIASLIHTILQLADSEGAINSRPLRPHLDLPLAEIP